MNVCKIPLTEDKAVHPGNVCPFRSRSSWDWFPVPPAAQRGRFKSPNLNCRRWFVKMQCCSPVVQLLTLRQPGERPHKQPASTETAAAPAFTPKLQNLGGKTRPSIFAPSTTLIHNGPPEAFIPSPSSSSQGNDGFVYLNHIPDT